MSASPWRGFIRAFAEEIDRLCAPEQRDELLRLVGRRMALQRPLPQVEALDALQAEINEALAAWDWGQANLIFDQAAPCVRIVHTGLPDIAPHGAWLAACLEGLYCGWLAAQPGADPALVVERLPEAWRGVLELRYVRPKT